MPQTQTVQAGQKETTLGRIPDSWQVVSADSFCLKVADGTHDTPKETADGKYLVTSKHIKNGRVDLSSAYKISKDDFDEINRRSKVDQWDVLFSMIGTVGEISLVDDSPDYAIKNIGLFKCGTEAKAKWLYYFLRSSIGQSEIQKRLNGTTQAYIPLGALRDFPVITPLSDREMAEIVGILSALDDKIELLRAQNKTLEGMAQALFKQWFMKFDFPDANGRPYRSSGGKMVESELGEIPEGWRVGKLGDTVDITIGRTPPRKESHWFSENRKDVKWLSIKDLGDAGVYTLKTTEYLTQEAVKKHRVPVVPTNTVVISFKLTVGRVAITGEEMVTNEAIAHLRPHEASLSSEYLYLYFKNFDFDTIGSTSSIATAFNSESLRNLLALVPAVNLISKFTELVAPLFEKIKNNTFEIEKLTISRDALLPELMKGRITCGNRQ